MKKMEEEIENILPEEDYYQFLNVPRTASLDEISSAFRRFSLVFHPDKHNVGTNRRIWAETVFNKIKEAYEVLSDPHKRAIYDTLGKKGLEVDGWEVIRRTQTPNEIRKEYERLKREREEKRLQLIANPTGTLTISIDATDLFPKRHDEYDIFEEVAIIPNIEVSCMTIEQSMEASVSASNTLSLSGDVSAENGTGIGSLTISNRHWMSEKTCVDVQYVAGNGSQFGVKLLQNISRLMFLTCGTSLEFTSKGILPSYVAVVGRQLDARTMGYVVYKKNGNGGSAMVSEIVRASEKYHLNASVQIGSPHSFVSLTCIRKFPDYGLKLRIALKYGTVGAIAEYGAVKTLSTTSSVGAAVEVGVPSGVTLKLKWKRASQSIVVPIHLCEEFMPAPLLYATFVPVVSWLLVRKLILDPIEKRRLERDRQKAMETHSERLLEMRQEAHAMVELMKETYMRIKSEEKNKKGLIIVRGLYGKLPEGATNHESHEEQHGDSPSSESVDPDTEVIDVTIPLQCLVKDSRLELVAGSKAGLPGFFNPCMGEDRHLTVYYSSRGFPHCCTIADNQAVVLPCADHRMHMRTS